MPGLAQGEVDGEQLERRAVRRHLDESAGVGIMEGLDENIEAIVAPDAEGVRPECPAPGIRQPHQILRRETALNDLACWLSQDRRSPQGQGTKDLILPLLSDEPR